MYLRIVGGCEEGAAMPDVPPRAAAKIFEIGTVLASVMLALDPGYSFSGSKLARCDLSTTEIMCRAAALDSALGSIRRNSTSC